jgi:hypothetical protein
LAPRRCAVERLHGAQRHARTAPRWSATIYAKNLVNSQYILVPPTQMNEFENLTNQYTVNRPREIGLRVGYAF